MVSYHVNHLRSWVFNCSLRLHGLWVLVRMDRGSIVEAKQLRVHWCITRNRSQINPLWLRRQRYTSLETSPTRHPFVRSATISNTGSIFLSLQNDDAVVCGASSWWQNCSTLNPCRSSTWLEPSRKLESGPQLTRGRLCRSRGWPRSSKITYFRAPKQFRPSFLGWRLRKP